MSTLERLWRNLGWMTIVLAIAILVHGAALCYVKQAALPSATLIILALIVGIGLLPGSYLQALLDRGARRVSKAKPKLIPLAAIVLPAVALLCAGFFGYEAWVVLRIVAEVGLETTPGRITLVAMIVLGGIGAFFLVLNAVTLVRAARHKQEPK
jgi:tellurite resistance protein TehA-like permease